MKPDNCLFCKIANGEIEAATIFEDKNFKVILDRFPGSKGHTLIIPKEHIENIYDLDAETASKMFALTTMIAKGIKKELNCDGLNILQNNGKAAGQTVFHFHIHLIPRFRGDGMKFKWETIQYTEEELQEIADCIKEKL